MTAFTAVCYPNYQNLQKVGYDIVIFSGNVLGHAAHAWHTWCKKGTNGKRMSCSLLIGYMQMFKSLDFRTMGLWKWITFILIHTVVLVPRNLTLTTTLTITLILVSKWYKKGTIKWKSEIAPRRFAYYGRPNIFFCKVQWGEGEECAKIF